MTSSVNSSCMTRDSACSDRFSACSRANASSSCCIACAVAWRCARSGASAFTRIASSAGGNCGSIDDGAAMRASVMRSSMACSVAAVNARAPVVIS